MVDVVLAQQPVEERHELVEAVDPLLERALLAEDAGVEVTAGAEAAEEPAAGEVVEGEHVARERVGMAVVGRRHERAEADRRRDTGGGASVGTAANHGESGSPLHTRWS